MKRSKGLHQAKTAKKDEFYTQLTDIEEEVWHYKEHFKDKVVYCNCDDPSISNFFKFFFLNFEYYGLKKLITTSYQSSYHDLFSKHDAKKSVGIEFTGGTDLTNIKKFQLKGDGDFRSEECIEILKQTDIVVTNPPFSLFREYVAQLIQHDKNFLIIGNLNTVTAKEIFPLIKNNQMWLGPSITSGDREFEVPEHYPATAAKHRDTKDGRRFIRVKSVRWFTNLDHKKRHQEMTLYKEYSPDEYPKYGNYEAIEVGITSEIPEDYDGVMGVPITFFDKLNPDQFEVLGITSGAYASENEKNGLYKRYTPEDSPNYRQMNGNARAVIGEPNGQWEMKYVRILIRNRKL